MGLRNPVIPRGCSYPASGLVDRLHAVAPSRTDAALSERLGISYKTWRRIVSGQPVRVSVIARLEARLNTLESSKS